MDDTDVKMAIQIAVLENEVSGLREQHKNHKIETVQAIDKLTVAVFDAIDGIRLEIKNIYEFINKSKGWAAAVILLSSILGGTMVAVVTVGLQHIWK